MNSKKAQGMPINVIIIAVIALILLVVILAITSGKLKVFGKGTANCKALGGNCESSCPPSGKSSEQYKEIEGTSCKDEIIGNTCCIALY
ncbi:hypothetical protein J4206_03725 [Candidatus Woesearchaeota archaeon]|nr:hypothetical protein [Candidatus Woesearchaeota archaeon]